MNILEIKALLPGSGKTTTLVNLFKKANLDNKIIITPSNKARQVCIQKLGLPYEEACKYVKTLKSFKRNYVSVLLKEDDDSDTYVTVESKDRVTVKPYNIFVDEASMISDWEMQDLIKHFRIQNLVLDGDSLQFDPIGCKQAILDSDNTVVRNSEGNLFFTEDEGKAYNLPINHQVLLNKQMRAQDEKLQNAIDLIKKGDLIEAICYILENHAPVNCENKYTDQHIAYTNAKCDKLNQMYANPRKWIVAKDDKMHSFFTSEIIEDSSRRFSILEQQLMYESIINNEKKIPNFSEWKTRHLKPAYAITCHKLQGSTVAEGDIFIHLDDILFGFQEVVNTVERAKLFQRFLYVAVSRAVSINQVNLYGCNKEDLLSMMKRAQNPVENEYTDFCNEVLDKLMELDELTGELVDESIKSDAVQFAADDEKLLDYLESCLNFKVEEDELYLKYKKEHYGEEFSKAQKGKHSKPHKPHKPHNYDPQMIEDAKNMRCNEWRKKWGKSDTLYRKLKA